MFAGQGSQYTSMGKELSDCSKAAKAVFDMVDHIRPEMCIRDSYHIGYYRAGRWQFTGTLAVKYNVAGCIAARCV